MATQRIVWTALPNGIDPESGKRRLSVLVSPRLVGDSRAVSRRIEGYANWRDWPATISAATFTVKVGGQSVAASLVSSPQTSIWKAMFPDDTPVRDWEFDASKVVDNTILTVPTTLVNEIIEEIYVSEAVQADGELPDRQRLGVRLSRRISPERQSPEVLLRRLRAESKDRRGGTSYNRDARASGLYTETRAALDVLRAYHTPLNKETTAPSDPDNPDGFGPDNHPSYDKPRAGGRYVTHEESAKPTRASLRKRIDFHRIAGAIGQFHFLSRACGLVLDLECDALPTSVAGQPVEVEVDWAPLPGVTKLADVYPRTMTLIASSTFAPVRSNNAVPINGRYLNLSDDLFSVIQTDIDGGGTKLTNSAQSMRRALPRQYTDDSADEPREEAGLPSLRSAGLMLVEKRRDVTVAESIDRNAAMETDLVNSGTAPTLYAEDLIKGLRIDVWDDQSTKWHSLCARKVKHQLLNTGETLGDLTDEGVATLAAQHSGDGNNPDILKLSEALALWAGWSLAAPEPGRTIKIDETDPAGPVKDQDEEVPEGMPLKSEYAPVPGTLPRLRFGWTYKMRARIVDLAGNSAPFDPDGGHPSTAETDETTYRRNEPIEPPIPLLVRRNNTTLPLRPSEGSHQIVIRTLNDVPAKNTTPTTDVSERHVAPPRVTQRMAETHGMLDTASGGRLDPTWYNRLVNIDQSIPEFPVQRESATETHVAADDGFELPYLPDPMATAILVRVLGMPDVDPNKPIRVPLFRSNGAVWPMAEPFRILLLEDPTSPTSFRTETGALVITLPKALRARLRISCEINPQRLNHMAIVHWIRSAAGRDVNKNLGRLINRGQHYMLTPWRNLEVIHAVQKPLILPDISKMLVSRVRSETAANLQARQVPLHANSTGRIDMLARWADPVDDPTSPLSEGTNGAPTASEQREVAFKKDVLRNEAPNDRYLLQGQHLLPNTHYRRVEYSLDATTRYKEFMDEPIRTDPDALKITSPVARKWVVNSAPPPPPEILYMVPTFGWSRSSTDERESSYRFGGGLRVYLARPWLVTGFTEMLGVVIPNPPGLSTSAIDNGLGAAITQWGLDPTKSGDGTINTPAPTLSAFPLAKRKGPIAFDGTTIPAIEGQDLPPGNFAVTNLPYPRTPQIGGTDQAQPPANANIQLGVAPHQVGYDEERQLWYADIVVRAPKDAYFPFIRFAFARYNPISLPDCRLSSLVSSEFQQLVPDRLVIVTKDPQGQSAHVAVYGNAGNSAPNGVRSRPNAFRVETEILPSGADPDLGWQKREPREQIIAAEALTLRRSLDSDSRRVARLRSQAEQVVQRADADALRANPDLMLALRPPLLWETDVKLPSKRSGEKRRLLITEEEIIRRETDDKDVTATDGLRPAIGVAAPTGRRIVYMETLDVSDGPRPNQRLQGR
ncbi:MAG: hypothetical protein HRU11_02560 [Parvularculaceae bacterium]|nr:hypothetical protein [Parvularculaceae bacterium]